MPTDKTYWKPDRLVYKRKPKKKQALLNRGRLVILGAMMLMGLFYWGVYAFLHLDYFQIKSVEVNGLVSLAREDVTQFVAAELKGDVWLTLPRANILFFSPAPMEKKLESKFPLIAKASVRKVLPGVLLVSIVERELWAIYCLRKSAASASSTLFSREEGMKRCYFMDKEGVVFAEAPETKGTLIRKIISDSDSDAAPGSKKFSGEEIADFAKIESVFKERTGLLIAGFEMHKNAPLDLWLIANEGFAVIITRAAAFESTADVVKAVLENKPAAERARFDYIDARFGNKVFVKYRNSP